VFHIQKCPNCRKKVHSYECHHCGFNLFKKYMLPQTIVQEWNHFQMWSKTKSDLAFLLLLFLGLSVFIGIYVLVLSWEAFVFWSIIFGILLSGYFFLHVMESRAGSKFVAELNRFEAEQRAKGLVKFASVLGHVKWGSLERVKEWKIIDMDMRNNFSGLTPRQFEKLVADLFAQMGYETELTPKTTDYGADVIAKKGVDTIAIQVKRFKKGNKVGNRDVQRLLGSMYKYNANKAVFVTSSDFTSPAHRQASNAPIELWNYKTLCEMIERYVLRMQ